MKAGTARKRLEGWRETVQRRRRAWDVPGVGVGVLVGGETVFAEGLGRARVGGDIPVTADTVFAICSCSKAFTTMLLAMLVDEGKLDWERPVRDVLPEFELHDPVASARLTPRDLVTHRSGLPRHDYAWFGSPATREELVRALRHLEPTADLRTKYQYQNLMYMTAGYLVGRVTGSSWEAELRRRILEPVGMASTTTSVRDSQADPGAARPHARSRGQVREIAFRDLDALGPAGAINSSVDDMLKWLRLFHAGGRVGGKRLVSDAQLMQMHAPQMAIPDAEWGDPEFRLSSYGLGWTVLAYRGRKVITHSGGIDGFRCRTLLLPEEQVGTVVLTNGESALPHVLTFELVDTLLDLAPSDWSRRMKADVRRAEADGERRRRRWRRQRVGGTKPTHRLADYAGVFRHPGYGTFTVRRAGKGLQASLNDLHGRLRHYHYDVFEFIQPRLDASPLRVSFQLDAGGAVERLAIPLQDGLEDRIFQRDPDGAARSAAAD